MLLLLAALQTPHSQNFPELDHPGANSSIAATIAKLCPSPAPNDRGELLRIEQRVSDSVSRKPTAGGLTALACVRGDLYEAGAFTREGYLIPSGASWSEAAVLALTKAITLKPAQPKAAELLAVLALEDAEPAHMAEIVAAIRASIAAGITTPGVLRGCSELAMRGKDFAGARRCATMALAAGVDSSWHLVELARLAFRDADTVSGTRWFVKAAGTAHDSVALDDLAWHLQWFLTPDERHSWERLADSAREHWMRDHLAERDVRDGQPFGARLAEHFNRLEYVMDHFRLRVQRRTREALRTGPHGDPDAKLANDTVIMSTCEPGEIEATPFRFYRRWQTDIDDRGVVWMRYGAPTKRVIAEPSCRLGDPSGPKNAREIWLYEIDGQRMLLNFEVEMFSGSVEATRLVSGVLGSYMCDVDPERCRLNELSFAAANAASAKFGTAPQTPMLTRGDIARLHSEDDAYIATATTTDDNSPRTDKNVEVTSRLHRLWDPLSGASIALVTYAFPVKDLSIQEQNGRRTTLVDLELRQWDPAADRWRDTTFSHHFIVPDTSLKRPNLIGFTVTSSTPGVSSWSLVARQPDERRGRYFDLATPGLATGAIALSDIVIGAESQGLMWSLHNVEIPLAAADVVDRRTAVSLYYQIRSNQDRGDLRVTVALYRTDGGVRDTVPALQVSYDQGVRRGINEVAPTLDVSRVEKGQYQLEVRLADATGAVLVRRHAGLELIEEN